MIDLHCASDTDGERDHDELDIGFDVERMPFEAFELADAFDPAVFGERTDRDKQFELIAVNVPIVINIYIECVISIHIGNERYSQFSKQYTIMIPILRLQSP
jgi:hypothetical protein